MPRVNNLNPTKRKLERISDYIRHQMKVLRIRQSKMAAELLISQPAFSVKLNNGTFTAEELLKVFEILKTTKEEAGELMS